MPRTTYKTYLMHSEDGTAWEKFIDVKETPDLGSTPPTIDVTTLSDGQKMYLNDIIDTGNLEFTANWDKDDFKKLKAVEGKKGEKWAIWYGGKEVSGAMTPDGSEGKFEFEGELAVWAKGNTVSASSDIGFSIAPSTEIKYVDGASA